MKYSDVYSNLTVKRPNSRNLSKYSLLAIFHPLLSPPSLRHFVEIFCNICTESLQKSTGFGSIINENLCWMSHWLYVQELIRIANMNFYAVHPEAIGIR